MSEDYFDLAYINHGQEVILHGRRADQSEVRQALDDAQKREVEALSGRHEAEMQKLLRGFAS